MSFAWMKQAGIRMVLQSEAAECGLASLTMVASHYGHRVNLNAARVASRRNVPKRLVVASRRTFPTGYRAHADGL